MKLLPICLWIVFSLSAHGALTQEERKDLFSGATQRLKNSGIEKKVPQKGEQFPDLSLNGKLVSEYVKSGSLVVTFYRGGWCPYCVKQLKDINTALKDLKSSGATLVAISPEKDSEVRKTKSKNNLDFPMISDPGNALAKKLNLTFTVEPEVAKEYKSLGLDLLESQGNGDNVLPMPATFVIGSDRRVLYVFADADYTKRASLDDVKAALKTK